jgi:selenocysteine-specific elongation factor
VRVRGVQVHGAAVRAARAGQRTAVNLGGVETASIERGMVLAPAGRLQPTQIIDARVEVLRSAPRPLRSRQRVRVHVGAAEVLARVSVLEDEGEVAPGAAGLAQLRLEAPVVALPGERFIVRSYSPQQTVAGGEVVDAHATKHRGRERRTARARLASLAGAPPAERATYFVETSGEKGLRRAELASRTGWRDEVLDGVLREAAGGGAVVEAEGVYVSRGVFDELLRGTLAELEAHHAREPLARGMARETLRERLFARAAPEVFRAVMREGEGRGALVSERDVVRASTHSLDLSPEDAAARDLLEKTYREAALEAPALEDALAAAGPSRERARKLLQLLLDAGTLVRVREDLLFHRDALAALTASLRDYGARHEPERLIDVAAFKELSGVSRKYAIPLLEYFDRERVTRRAGDRRLIL